MWKLHDFAEGVAKADNTVKMKEMLYVLQEKIPEMKNLEVGINICESPDAYDIVACSEFANADDLQVYQKHEEHQNFIKSISGIREKKKVVDYEV
jgi:hypothetical protein